MVAIFGSQPKDARSSRVGSIYGKVAESGRLRPSRKRNVRNGTWVQIPSLSVNGVVSLIGKAAVLKIASKRKRCVGSTPTHFALLAVLRER